MIQCYQQTKKGIGEVLYPTLGHTVPPSNEEGASPSVPPCIRDGVWGGERDCLRQGDGLGERECLGDRGGPSERKGDRRRSGDLERARSGDIPGERLLKRLRCRPATALGRRGGDRRRNGGELLFWGGSLQKEAGSELKAQITAKRWTQSLGGAPNRLWWWGYSTG